MTRTAIAVLAALILAPASAAAADNLAGQASVIDGDTLEIHGTRIRLWGIDAPESSQLCRGEDSLQYRCGAKVANDLDAFIASRTVNCLPISLDRYGRTVATCLVGGADLGDWLVRNGLALETGRSIQNESTTMRSMKPSKPGEGCGQGATSSPGFSASVSGEAGYRVTVRMTRTPILENKPQGPPAGQSQRGGRYSCRCRSRSW
jgi:endonuclease YncB( thermonuclease family)